MDVFGNALLDLYKNGEADILWLHNTYDEVEEMPVDIFFRAENEMPELELKALQLCKGKVLDIGAGVGSHALILQNKKTDVTAIDVSVNAVNIMKHRGVKKAFVQDIFKYKSAKFDTLLLLMNGIGLSGTLIGFKNLLKHIKTLLNPDGQVIFDSSNISYLYQETELPKNQYYGEISYQYEYKKQKGDWFNWLYLDQETLKNIADEMGWNCEVVFDDSEDQYLAKLSEKNSCS